jgi:hypothetical protein
VASETVAPAPPAVRRRQRLVMTGLLLSFAGFVLVAFELPTAPGALVRILPVVAAGILALWIGGLLLGVARPARRNRAGAP